VERKILISRTLNDAMTVDVRSERRLFLGKCLWEELGAKSGSDGVARPRVVVESYEVGLWNFVGSPVGRL
jgi:hypothetical protein